MSPSHNNNRAAWLVANLPVVIASLVIAAILLHYHYDLVRFPFQWEYREGAPLVQVRAWMNGKNIYALDEMPFLLNVYGWLHTFVYACVGDLFGATLAHLRMATGVLILCSVLICFLHIRRLSGDIVLALVLAVGLYLQWLHFVIPLVRPDALGILVFVSGLAVASRSRPSFGWACLMFAWTLAAFFCKGYFVLIGPVVFSYWTLFINLRKGLLLSVIFGVAGVAAILLLDHFVPGYLSSSVFSQFTFAAQGMSSTGWSYLWYQLQTYLPVTSALWCVLAVLIVKALIAKTGDRTLGFHLYALTLMSLALVLKLGHPNGAYLTYFFELASAPLAFAVAQSWPLLRERLTQAAMGKIALIAVTAYSMHLILMSDEDKQAWKAELAQAAAATDGYKNVWASPLLASYMGETGRTVFDTGQNEYFSSELARAGNPLGLGIPAPQIAATFARFEQARIDGILNEKFDLIVTDQATEKRWFDKKMLEEHYVQKNPQPLTPWKLKYWTPRHTAQ